MGNNIAEFGREIEAAYQKKVVQKFREFHRAVALNAYKTVTADSRDVGIAYGSPVWSGQFRSGHNISIGTPDFTPPKVNEDARYARWPDEPDTILAAPAMAEAARKLLPLEAFSMVYIANAAPYARRLEGGYSKLKAPEGVYKIAAMVVINKFKNAATQLSKAIGA